MKALFFSASLLLFLPLSTFASSENIKIRLGVAQVSPNDDSGTVLGGGVGVESSTSLGISLTYMFRENWGVEVLGALPFSHDIKGTGLLSGVDIGETKHLPPTVSLIYQWGEGVKYHLGLGLNYTVFFDEKAAGDLNAALGTEAELDLSASTGLAGKFGFDIPMGSNWNFTTDIYYIAIDTTADIRVNNSVAASVDVDIDPVVFMLGVGRSF